MVGIVVWKFPLSQAMVKRLVSCGKVFQLDWTCVGHLDSCFSMGKFLIGLNLHWSPGFLFSYGEISDWMEPVLVTWIPVYPWGNFWLDWTCLGHQDSCFLIGLNLYWSSGFLFPHTLNSPPNFWHNFKIMKIATFLPFDVCCGHGKGVINLWGSRLRIALCCVVF